MESYITVMSCQSLATMKMRNVWKIFSSITEFLLKICQTSWCWVTQNHKEAELMLWAKFTRKSKNQGICLFSQVEDIQANRTWDSDMILQISKPVNNVCVSAKNLEIISCLLLKQPMQPSYCIAGSTDSKVVPGIHIVV